MEYVKINGNQYPARIRGYLQDRDWDNRKSKAITLEMSYEEALATFVNDVPWSIIHQPDSYIDENGATVTPDPVEYDNSEYSVSGSVTDHRNGVVTVKMGKKTEVEIVSDKYANAVTQDELEAAYVEGVNSL